MATVVDQPGAVPGTSQEAKMGDKYLSCLSGILNVLEVLHMPRPFVFSKFDMCVFIITIYFIMKQRCFF